MNLKQKLTNGVITLAVAGGVTTGAVVHKGYVRDLRADLLEQARFTKENPELCKGATAHERCLDLGEFKQLVKEMNKVKNKNAGDKVKSLDEKLNDKLLK